MTVVERVRELGLLRAAGATRDQLPWFILVQARHRHRRLGPRRRPRSLLARGIAAWLRTVGSVPSGRTVGSPADVIAIVAIGLVVTLAAAARTRPPRRSDPAGRSPQARLDLTRRDALACAGSWRSSRPWASSVSSSGRGAAADALARAWASTALLLVVALLVPLMLPALARLAGIPFSLLSALEERLARASVLRDRSRAALTVGALTIGLAMIVALGGVGQHARAAAGAWITDVVPGDLV